MGGDADECDSVVALGHVFFVHCYAPIHLSATLAAAFSSGGSVLDFEAGHHHRLPTVDRFAR